MVPGLSERERRAADVQRLEWLADAVLGPARSSAGHPSRIRPFCRSTPGSVL